MNYDLVGFADEDSARRTAKAVQQFERDRINNRGDARGSDTEYFRITGPGNYAGSLSPSWGQMAADRVVASNDPNQADGFETIYEGVIVIYPSNLNTAPVAGNIVEGRFAWSDDNGNTVWFALCICYGGNRYPYSYGIGQGLDAIVIPVPWFECSGGSLMRQIRYHQIFSNNISQIVHSSDPNLDGTQESFWWCVGGACVEATDPPHGYNAGPFVDQATCAANCI